MKKIELLQEYRDFYYKEIEHSERLNNKSGTFITFLTILGSTQVLLWTQFKSFEIHVYSVIYLVLSVISLVFFAVSVIKFYHCFSGYSYNYFPIEGMARATVDTYEIAGDNEEDIKLADEHIYNMYCERFLNDAITNRKTNIDKNNKHKKLTQIICISFIVTAIVFSYGLAIDYYESRYVDNNTTHIEVDGGEINVRG